MGGTGDSPQPLDELVTERDGIEEEEDHQEGDPKAGGVQSVVEDGRKDQRVNEKVHPHVPLGPTALPVYREQRPRNADNENCVYYVKRLAALTPRHTHYLFTSRSGAI